MTFYNSVPTSSMHDSRAAKGDKMVLSMATWEDCVKLKMSKSFSKAQSRMNILCLVACPGTKNNCSPPYSDRSMIQNGIIENIYLLGSNSPHRDLGDGNPNFQQSLAPVFWPLLYEVLKCQVFHRTKA